jgi:arylsulfatase
MMGTRGIWRDGWQANTTHPPSPSAWAHYDQDRWCLYELHTDRNQLHDLAAERPELLEELKALWHEQAKIYNGYPLDDRTAPEVIGAERPSMVPPNGQFLLYPGGAEIPERVLPMVGRSFRVIAWVSVDDPDCEGVLFACGGRFGGHSLYLKDRRLHYVYNLLGQEEQKISSPEPLQTGHMTLGVDFTKTGRDGPFPSGTATLHVNDEPVISQQIRVQPGFFSLCGEGSNVGRDRGQPVSSDYRSPFALRGATIDHVLLKPGDDVYLDLERETEAAFRRD